MVVKLPCNNLFFHIICQVHFNSPLLFSYMFFTFAFNIIIKIIKLAIVCGGLRSCTLKPCKSTKLFEKSMTIIKCNPLRKGWNQQITKRHFESFQQAWDNKLGSWQSSWEQWVKKLTSSTMCMNYDIWQFSTTPINRTPWTFWWPWKLATKKKSQSSSQSVHDCTHLAHKGNTHKTSRKKKFLVNTTTNHSLIDLKFWSKHTQKWQPPRKTI
jgi:hypothetical protein